MQDQYNDDNTERDAAGEHDDAIIAVVGLACHLPGANNLDEYWENLHKGVESVQFFTDEELLAFGESAEQLANPAYVRAQPVLQGYDQFDARFWGWSPQDAAVTDPAHRIFLEVAYQALEHAGHTGYDDEGRVGVFASSGASQYWMDNLKTNPALMAEMGEFLVRHTGNDMNFLATRLSYELDFRGPSINVQTACSSTLVGIHMAVQSLLGGECDTALVGGATVLLPQQRGYVYKEGEILSPDGHCRPFDANSAGTVFGSGAGAVVLRRLEDALADGDTIYATVVGSAINNDGARKIGYLAPGVEGQVGAISEALEISGVNVEDVAFVEAHGTGTKVGDPIEFEALNQVYKELTDKQHYCRVGSVKSNIGHLGEAAGIASLIKVILSLGNKKIPPTINYQSPNPDIELDNSPFVINDQLVDWHSDGGQRLAGITALGAGGTNAHLIIAEAPGEKKSIAASDDDARSLLVLSAKTATALQQARARLAAALREQTDTPLCDVAFTLQQGRRAYNYRLALAVQNHSDAIALLEGDDNTRVAVGQATSSAADLVFMFPGGGAQYAGMGADLYRPGSAYREAFDACMQCLAPELAEQVRELVFAAEHQREAASSQLERPSRTLPALFATEYALARQLMNWGATPNAFIGHSMGEYTAACLSDVMQLRDAMQLVALRGELFERVAEGAMLSISLSESEARQFMPASLDIAAVNAPDLCVASGPVADIEQLQAELERQAIDTVRIRINVAAHSAMLDDILERFRSCCQSMTFSAPKIPFTSNYSGDWITKAQATDPNYWVDHLRNTVRFSDNVATVLAGQPSVLLEVGPGRTLMNLAKANDSGAQLVLNSMRHPSEHSNDLDYALRTYGSVWAAGVDVDWKALNNACYGIYWHGRRVALPTYSFERKAYWIEPGASAQADTPATALLKKQSNIDDWFGQYQWVQSPAPSYPAQLSGLSEQQWLIFADQCGVAEQLDQLLQANNIAPSARLLVLPGRSFEHLGENRYSVDITSENAMRQLFGTLEDQSLQPGKILYLPPLNKAYTDRSAKASASSAVEAALDSCFWGLFNLGKVLSELEQRVDLTVVSSDMHALASVGCKEKSLLIGPVTVLPHELPHVNTQALDFDSKTDSAKLARSILAENLILSDAAVGGEQFITYRGLQRWSRQIHNVTASTPSLPTDQNWLRPGGSYFISGGLGGIGLTIAEYLAKSGATQLILASRSALPDREQWQECLQNRAASDPVVLKIKAVQAIEASGARVYTPAVNITDLAVVRAVVNNVESHSGQAINGVIHAAGTIDDQLVLLKTQDSVHQVLDAKINGALVLDQVFDDQQLDFFVAFSSVASVLGLPGQIDYAAANAFLDAFADERAQRARGQTLVINWNAWRGVGMASAANQAEREHVIAGQDRQSVNHPNLDYRVSLASGESIYARVFAKNEHWLVAEHRVKNGNALIPGTGYLDLMFAIAQQQSQSDAQPQCVTLSDVAFLSPFGVEDTATLFINVEPVGASVAEQQFSLQFYSHDKALPHVTGDIAMTPAVESPLFDLAAARAQLQTPAVTKGRFLNQDFMQFGPRWGCIEKISYQGNAALLDIRLSSEFHSDLDNYALHPALMDMATGGAQFLIKGFDQHNDFYVPVAYRQIKIYQRLPAMFCSYINYRSDSSDGFVQFDIVVMDASGRILVDIERFTMKRVEAQFAAGGSQAVPAVDVNSAQGSRLDSLEEILKHAIDPAEGVEAFARVMVQQTQVQWLVSSVDLRLWLQQLNTQHKLNGQYKGEQDIAAIRYTRESDDNANDTEGFGDPNYVAPENEAQRKLAELWANTLGVGRVSIRDNFFELGGHSLLLIRMASKIKKLFGVNLPASEFFECPTVAQWADLVQTAVAKAEVSGEGGNANAAVKKIKRIARGAHKKTLN